MNEKESMPININTASAIVTNTVTVIHNITHICKYMVMHSNVKAVSLVFLNSPWNSPSSSDTSAPGLNNFGWRKKLKGTKPIATQPISGKYHRGSCIL